VPGPERDESHAPTRARLFVAAWLPEAVLDQLAALPRPEEAGVRYTRREQWHVTLRFLGSCDVALARAAFAAIDGSPAVAELGPVVSRLGRSVVVVPVRGLESLAAAVVRATATIGLPPDPRPFAGHVTIARLRHWPACRVAGARVHATFAVREVHLVRSDLRADGARYETVAVTSVPAAQS
jgi:2'-5' RNA ligase